MEIILVSSRSCNFFSKRLHIESRSFAACASSGAGKFLAWIGVGILAAHTVLGLLLTAQTFRASRSGGKLYGKQNALFWARRTSGLAILLMLFFHIGVFGRVQDGVYILFPFTTVRLLTQLLLVASVFVHLLLNLRPDRKSVV